MSASASTNTSATGGFLLDRPPPPLSGDQLTAILQTMVASLANLPGPLVRPRWQAMPPTQPPPDVTWAAVGVTMIEADDYPSIRHDGVTRLAGAPGAGVDRMQRHATVTVMVSLYGPEAEDAGAQMRDALYIPQQIEMLGPLRLFAVHDLARAPELVNQQWINRIDMRIEFRMQIDRVYPVLNIEGADVLVRGATGVFSQATIREVIEP